VIDIHGGGLSVTGNSTRRSASRWPGAELLLLLWIFERRSSCHIRVEAGAMRFYIEQAPLVAARPALPGTAYPAQIADVN
jgi:hypothetical protein